MRKGHIDDDEEEEEDDADTADNDDGGDGGDGEDNDNDGENYLPLLLPCPTWSWPKAKKPSSPQ